MLFFHPMWDNESQRIGKRKCTPLGYLLHGIAELLGFLGLLLLLGVCGYLGYKRVNNELHASLFWLLAIPFGLGLVSEAMMQVSWVLAARKGFEYDYEHREATWIEHGRRVTYRWRPHESE